jgi:hypothetical protein
MNTLYDILIDLSKRPAHIIGMGESDMIRFDLDRKDITSKGKYIMKGGELQVEKIRLSDGREYDLKGIKFIEDSNKEISYEAIESLWHEYFVSVPSARSQHARCNFKAKHETELTFKEMLGASRICTQYRLEAFILLHSLTNDFKWNNDKFFYWQSKRYPKLILFKNWLQNAA